MTKLQNIRRRVAKLVKMADDNEKTPTLGYLTENPWPWWVPGIVAGGYSGFNTFKDVIPRTAHLYGGSLWGPYKDLIDSGNYADFHGQAGPVSATPNMSSNEGSDVLARVMREQNKHTRRPWGVAGAADWDTRKAYSLWAALNGIPDPEFSVRPATAGLPPGTDYFTAGMPPEHGTGSILNTFDNTHRGVSLDSLEPGRRDAILQMLSEAAGQRIMPAGTSQDLISGLYAARMGQPMTPAQRRAVNTYWASGRTGGVRNQTLLDELSDVVDPKVRPSVSQRPPQQGRRRGPPPPSVHDVHNVDTDAAKRQVADEVRGLREEIKRPTVAGPDGTRVRKGVSLMGSTARSLASLLAALGFGFAGNYFGRNRFNVNLQDAIDVPDTSASTQTKGKAGPKVKEFPVAPKD